MILLILTRFCSEFLNASIWQNFLTELLRNWAFVYKINKVYWHKKSEAITEKKNVLNLDKKASNRFLLTLKSPFDIFLAAKQQKVFTFLSQDSPHVSGMCELGPQKRSLPQQKSFKLSRSYSINCWNFCVREKFFLIKCD